MFVFAAWLNFSYVRAVTTQDIVATVDGVPRIRHYVVDLTRSLGSGMFDGAEAGRGKATRRCCRRGRRSARTSRALAWRRRRGCGRSTPICRRSARSAAARSTRRRGRPPIPMPPFANRLPDDTFWAARQVMAFTDEEIRAIVQTGQYSKPAEDWITATLIERRNRIGRTYFAQRAATRPHPHPRKHAGLRRPGRFERLRPAAHVHDHVAQVRQRRGTRCWRRLGRARRCRLRRARSLPAPMWRRAFTQASRP